MNDDKLIKAFNKIIAGGKVVNNTCCMCGVPQGYVSDGYIIGQDSSCGCSAFHSNPQAIPLQEFIEFVTQQKAGE
jgi:hypothetical protein